MEEKMTANIPKNIRTGDGGCLGEEGYFSSVLVITHSGLSY